MTTCAPASPQVSPDTESPLQAAVQLEDRLVSERVAALLGKPDTEWTGADFRVFVFDETLRMNGPQLPVQEADKILTGFFGRFGANGPKIARHVFGELGGMWRGAPVTVRRFAERQDQFFAVPILAEIG